MPSTTVLPAGQSLTVNRLFGFRVIQSGQAPAAGTSTAAVLASYPSVAFNGSASPSHMITSLETYPAPPGQPWDSALFTNPAGCSSPLVLELADTATEVALLGVGSGSTSVSIGGAVTVNPTSVITNQNAPTIVLPAVGSVSALPVVSVPSAAKLIAVCQASSTSGSIGGVGSNTAYMPWGTSPASAYPMLSPVAANTMPWVDLGPWAPKALAMVLKTKGVTGVTGWTWEVDDLGPNRAFSGGAGDNDTIMGCAVGSLNFGNSISADGDGWQGCASAFLNPGAWSPAGAGTIANPTPAGRAAYAGGELPLDLFRWLRLKLTWSGTVTFPAYQAYLYVLPGGGSA
jgi:hypothetical protein